MVQVAGREHHLGTDEAVAYRRFADLLRTHGTSADAPDTFGGLLDAWVRLHPRERYKVGYLIQFARKNPILLARLSTDYIQRFADWLAKQTYQPGTRRGKAFAPAGARKPLARYSVKHYVMYARRVWRWATEQGWLAERLGPIRTMRPVPKPRDENVERIRLAFDKLPASAQSLCRFIVATGCRPKEARQLRWSDVGDVISLRAHKTDRTGHTRTIYLTPTARTILQSLPRTCEWVFPARGNKPYTAGGLRGMLRRAGVASVYSLRHTFAQWFLDHGGEDGGPGRLEDLQKLLGHRRITTTQIYAQVRERRSIEVANRLAGPLG